MGHPSSDRGATVQVLDETFEEYRTKTPSGGEGPDRIGKKVEERGGKRSSSVLPEFYI